MRIDCLTTFPQLFDSHMNESIMKNAQRDGHLEFHAHNLRDWAEGNYKKTDDYVYGGGEGLIMLAEPIFNAVADLLGEEEVEARIAAHSKNEACPNKLARIIIAAPQGCILNDKLATELSHEDRLFFICGHYEGLDERVYALADDVISIGDYVLTSGELSSTVIIDSVVRKIPGVLGAETGAVNESFSDYLLEHPQYTRPISVRGLEVPEILRSGNTPEIEKYNRSESVKRTWINRPDLIERALRDGLLSPIDLETLEKVKSRRQY